MKNQKLFFKSTAIATLMAAMSIVSFGSSAHGYVKSPESRAFACNQGSNVNCGAVQWEPQSVEGPSGFPESGPVDGKIASAGQGAFTALDEQTSSRWSKSEISSGWNQFTWQFTANHVTRNWRYYLTQPNWDTNSVLTRDSFDLEPFCVVDGGMVQPPKLVTHDCYLPSNRSGYQVILAVWEVGDTSNSFYNVIDVNVVDEDSTPAPWQNVGNINPSLDLKEGDKAMTRAFDANGEILSLQTSITITDAQQGSRDNWPYLLASAINTEQSLLKAGQKNAEGEILPVYGKNDVFAKQGSGIDRVEVSFDVAPVPGNNVEVTSLADSYDIKDGQSTVDFDVTTDAEMAISVFLYTHDGTPAGFINKIVNNETASFSLAVIDPKAGHHHMILKAVTKQNEIIQQSYDVFLNEEEQVGDADYVFPQGLTDYKAGTLVLQPKTGKVYECKPFPYSGYCVQWNESANVFEPGIGFAWQDAWIER